MIAQERKARERVLASITTMTTRYVDYRAGTAPYERALSARSEMLRALSAYARAIRRAAKEAK